MRAINKTKIVLFVVVILLLAVARRTMAQTELDEATTIKIDHYIQSQINEYKIPGLAIAIVEGDRLVYVNGYGTADPDGTPFTSQTTFITGSTGKAITASALMILVDEGKVLLDNPVKQYLPWFRLADEQVSDQITVRMVLNHTSGIPVNAGVASQTYSDVSPEALENQIRSFNTVKLKHAPGTAYEYANANYQIAGMIVEVVSGQSFQSFIQDRIFKPLDMMDSYTSRDEARKNGMATGYRYWFSIPLPAHDLPYSYRQFPAGWYISSAEDMAHFLIMHMNNGMYNGKRLISAEGIEELHKPALGNYAMGWAVDGQLISHNGSVPDYGTGVYFDTDKKYGVVVAFNVNTGYFFSPAYVIAPSVLNLLRGKPAIEPVTDPFYQTMITAISVAIILQVIWIAGSSLMLKRWQKNADKRPKSLLGKVLWFSIPLLIELGLAYTILSTFRSNSGNIAVAFLYLPDLTLLALISLFLAVGWAALRTILSAQLFSKTAG